MCRMGWCDRHACQQRLPGSKYAYQRHPSTSPVHIPCRSSGCRLGIDAWSRDSEVASKKWLDLRSCFGIDLSQDDSNYTATPLLAQPPGPLQAQNQSPQANHTQTDMAQKVAA